MRIIKQSEYEDVVSYDKVFGIEPNETHYGFPCDKDGIVDVDKLNPVAAENYKQCMANQKFYQGKPIVFLGVRKYENTYRHPAIGVCDVCEKRVSLDDPMTNTCDCGAEYNGSGQRLEDRRLWDGTDGAGSPDYE